jgi:hypothetical protein
MFEVCTKTYVGLRVNSQISVKIGMCGEILFRFASNEFHKKSFNDSRVVS